MLIAIVAIVAVGVAFPATVAAARRGVRDRGIVPRGTLVIACATGVVLIAAIVTIVAVVSSP